MPSKKLIEIKPSKGLDAGLFPSAEPSSGQIWNTGNNAWFRELALEASLGRTKFLPVIGRSSQAMASTFTQAGKKRLYFEDGGIIYFWEGTGFGSPIGALNINGDYWLEPWGDFLLATDNIGSLKYWQNSGSLAAIPDALTQFGRCAIVKKMAQMLLAYNTDVLPQGFHWCSINDPLTWTPALTNSARNLTIRNADSEIVAVEDLGVGHAVYFSDYMIIVQYVGPTNWFGTPNQAIQGIGAVGRKSVVGLGNYNFGLCRDGVFVTDGNSASFIDRPAFDKYIQSNIDWTKASSVTGYRDSRLGLIVWSVPVVGGGSTSIAIDPKMRTTSAEAMYLARKTFTFLDGGINAGLDRGVFDYPIVARDDGIYFTSVQDTTAGNFSLTSHMFDADDPEIFKSWDYGIFGGAFGSDAQVRFGFADVPDVDAIDWSPWEAISTRVPFGPRESVYLALDFKGDSTFKMTGATIYGEPAGSVN